eukprot:3471714-Rhodomonas_salina.1
MIPTRGLGTPCSSVANLPRLAGCSYRGYNTRTNNHWSTPGYVEAAAITWVGVHSIQGARMGVTISFGGG